MQVIAGPGWHSCILTPLEMAPSVAGTVPAAAAATHQGWWDLDTRPLPAACLDAEPDDEWRVPAVGISNGPAWLPALGDSQGASACGSWGAH